MERAKRARRGVTKVVAALRDAAETLERLSKRRTNSFTEKDLDLVEGLVGAGNQAKASLDAHGNSGEIRIGVERARLGHVRVKKITADTKVCVRSYGSPTGWKELQR